MRDTQVGRDPVADVVKWVTYLYVGAVVAWLAIGVLPSLTADFGGFRSLVDRIAGGDSSMTGVAERIQDSALNARHPARVTLDYLFAAVNLGLGVLVLRRRPHDRVAQLLAVGMIGTAVTFNVPSHALLDVVTLGVVHQFHDAVHVVSGIAYTYAVVLFPDGRLIPVVRTDRAARARLAAYLAAAVIIGVITYDRISVGHPGQAYFVRLFGLVIPIAGVAAQTYRLRRANDAVTHQQSTALRWGLVPLLLAGIAFSTLPIDESLSLVVFPFVIVLVPVSIMVGIFRYRLWDIDVIVNRALLVGLLVALVVAVDALVIAGAGRLFGLDHTNAFLWVVATAVAVLTLDPARRRSAAFANRVVYGTHTAPEDALADLVAGLDNAVSGTEAVDHATRALGEATGATVGVWPCTDDAPDAVGPKPLALWPPTASGAATAPPVQGTPGLTTLPIGSNRDPQAVLAITQPPGVAMSRAERALAEEIAAHISLVLRNDRLAAELQQRFQELSDRTDELRALRRRLLSMEDTARRRLERDIHDGAQQYLVALSIELDLAADMLSDGDEATAGQLARVMGLTGEALTVLGALARGVYPETLREHGPAAALNAIPTGSSVTFEVHDGGLGRHDPEIEAGVYFSCLEAVQNACKHATPTRIRIEVGQADQRAMFTVQDDGRGFDVRVTRGSGGLRMLIDRVAALGGTVDVRSAVGAGTVVTGSIPLGPMAVSS